MNSGDWIENLTSLEYTNGQWSIYNYQKDPVAQLVDIDKKNHSKESAKSMLASLMLEMNIAPPSESKNATVEAVH